MKPVYTYYLYGQRDIRFPSFRACEEYYKQFSSSALLTMWMPDVGLAIVRENLNTFRKVIFQVSLKN